MRSITTLGLAVVMILALRGGPAWAGDDPLTFTSDFQTGFDGWQQQWHKESTSGTDGVATHSTERGYNDVASLKFDMGDGFGDDGTLWIEKQFAVPAGVPTPVSLSFQLFNEFQSDFSTFEVKAAISTQNPNEQADFTTIGSTDSAEGWVPFTYEDTIISPSGQVWVAAGIRVAWETPRVYWIDHVTVSTMAIPEPTTAALLALTFAGMLAALRSRR
ncbi:MAG TPA: PEP-CTERM sorting domain-containing protein [Lacipirellulaceae bacterium]